MDIRKLYPWWRKATPAATPIKPRNRAMTIQTTIRQLAAECKAANIDLPHLAPMLVEAFNEPAATNPYGAEGMTHPDTGTGFVRFKQLDDARASYLEDGQYDAAQALRYSYACYPGAMACEVGSIEQYSAANNTSNATSLRGMGYATWYNAHPAVEVKDGFGGSHFKLDQSVTVVDVYCLPYLELGTGRPINRTVDECVKYMLAQAATWVK